MQANSKLKVYNIKVRAITRYIQVFYVCNFTFHSISSRQDLLSRFVFHVHTYTYVCMLYLFTLRDGNISINTFLLKIYEFNDNNYNNKDLRGTEARLPVNARVVGSISTRERWTFCSGKFGKRGIEFRHTTFKHTMLWTY